MDSLLANRVSVHDSFRHHNDGKLPHWTLCVSELQPNQSCDDGLYKGKGKRTMRRNLMRVTTILCIVYSLLLLLIAFFAGALSAARADIIQQNYAKIIVQKDVYELTSMDIRL